MNKLLLPWVLLFLFTTNLLGQKHNFSHQDSLRGGIGQGRMKWDVLYYDITVRPSIETKSIEGISKITFSDSGVHTLQLDLQDPLIIDSIINNKQLLRYIKEGNVYWVSFPEDENIHKKIKPFTNNITIYYHGKPKEAVNPPWDGGWIWKKDANQNPWVSVACQGLGASVWYPCKDTQSDEPDEGCTLRIIVPDSLVGIGNGRLVTTQKITPQLTEYTWRVQSPINNYNIIPYIGKYKHFSEKYQGKKGPLDMDYWIVSDKIELAKKQFADAPKMMKAFEYWFGPYPFYKDGYKLVEAPHLGMEHQSAIAYGNQFKNGYLGTDLSETGWGLKWDFIIVHESGHEWFANNITTKDIADMWVHEGFTCYSEALFTEFYYGKKAGEAYVQGLRKNIVNDKPIIGSYNVNNEGSGDMYYKGANLIHTIRQIINDDLKFRKILIGLNKKFYHQTVSSKNIEDYFNSQTNIDLSLIFDQYLRTKKVPVLEYYYKKDTLYYRWRNTITNFKMPMKFNLQNEAKEYCIMATNEWQSIGLPLATKQNSPFKLNLNKNYYVTSKEVSFKN